MNSWDAKAVATLSLHTCAMFCNRSGLSPCRLCRHVQSAPEIPSPCSGHVSWTSAQPSSPVLQTVHYLHEFECKIIYVFVELFVFRSWYSQVHKRFAATLWNARSHIYRDHGRVYGDCPSCSPRIESDNLHVAAPWILGTSICNYIFPILVVVTELCARYLEHMETPFLVLRSVVALSWQCVND